MLFFLGIYPKKILRGEGATERFLTGFKRRYSTPITGHVSKLGYNTMAVTWSKILKNFNNMRELLSYS